MTEPIQIESLQPEIWVKIFTYLAKVRIMNSCFIDNFKDLDSTLPSASLLQVRSFISFLAAKRSSTHALVLCLSVRPSVHLSVVKTEFSHCLVSL